jgi:hypothetical protein
LVRTVPTEDTVAVVIEEELVMPEADADATGLVAGALEEDADPCFLPPSGGRLR